MAKPTNSPRSPRISAFPTSICFANGGVIVQESGNTLFLKDTKGDDVADERNV